MSGACLRRYDASPLTKEHKSMLKNLLTFAIVLAILTWVVSLNINAAFACNSAGQGCGGGPPPNIQPAPAPVAGGGILYLIGAGGYYAVRRWRSTSKNKL
jgi:hypothetical protein